MTKNINLMIIQIKNYNWGLALVNKAVFVCMNNNK